MASSCHCNGSAPDFVQQILIDRDNERFLADPGIDFAPLGFAKRESQKRMFARAALGRVFRGEGTKGHAELWLVETVLWQLRRGLGDESSDLLIVQRIEQPANFLAVRRLIVRLAIAQF